MRCTVLSAKEVGAPTVTVATNAYVERQVFRYGSGESGRRGRRKDCGMTDEKLVEELAKAMHDARTEAIRRYEPTLHNPYWEPIEAMARAALAHLKYD